MNEKKELVLEQAPNMQRNSWKAKKKVQAKDRTENHYVEQNKPVSDK